MCNPCERVIGLPKRGHRPQVENNYIRWSLKTSPPPGFLLGQKGFQLVLSVPWACMRNKTGQREGKAVVPYAERQGLAPFASRP